MVMARRGARIAIIDMDPAKIQKTVGLCTEAGGGAKGYEAHVTDEPVVERTRDGGVGEPLGCLHDDEGRAGDQTFGTEKPIDAGFRGIGPLPAGDLADLPPGYAEPGKPIKSW